MQLTSDSLDHDDITECTDTHGVDQPSYCYCQGQGDTMITCDNPVCPIE